MNTYKETDKYRIWHEHIGQQLFVHVKINEATPSSIREIKEGWAEFLIDAYFDGYENVFTYTKDNRIVNMIGNAEKVGEHEGFEVYKWVLN